MSSAPPQESINSESSELIDLSSEHEIPPVEKKSLAKVPPLLPLTPQPSNLSKASSNSSTTTLYMSSATAATIVPKSLSPSLNEITEIPLISKNKKTSQAKPTLNAPQKEKKLLYIEKKKYLKSGVPSRKQRKRIQNKSSTSSIQQNISPVTTLGTESSIGSSKMSEFKEEKLDTLNLSIFPKRIQEDFVKMYCNLRIICDRKNEFEENDDNIEADKNKKKKNLKKVKRKYNRKRNAMIKKLRKKYVQNYDISNKYNQHIGHLLQVHDEAERLLKKQHIEHQKNILKLELVMNKQIELLFGIYIAI